MLVTKLINQIKDTIEDKEQDKKGIFKKNKKCQNSVDKEIVILNRIIKNLNSFVDAEFETAKIWTESESKK